MRLKGMCQLLAVKNLGVLASDDGSKLHWGDGIHQRRPSMERRASFRRGSVSKDNKDPRERRPSLLQRLISHEREPPRYEEGGDTPPRTPENNQDGTKRGKSASSSIMDAVSKQGGFSDSMGTRPATSELSTPMNAGTPGGTPDGNLRPRIFLKKITHAKANFDLRVASVKPQVYVKPETWGELVSQGLKDRIMSEIIHEKAPDAVERAGMITHTLTRSYRLLLDEKLVAETMDEIDAELQKETGYISVAGGRGCGKTTLLSAWMKRHVDRLVKGHGCFVSILMARGLWGFLELFGRSGAALLLKHCASTPNPPNIVPKPWALDPEALENCARRGISYHGLARQGTESFPAV